MASGSPGQRRGRPSPIKRALRGDALLTAGVEPLCDIVRNIKMRKTAPLPAEYSRSVAGGRGQTPSANRDLPCMTIRPRSGVSKPARMRSNVEIFRSRTDQQWLSAPGATVRLRLSRTSASAKDFEIEDITPACYNPRHFSTAYKEPRSAAAK